MLVSALLHLLRRDEIPRAEATARPTEKFQELPAREMSSGLPPANLREIRQENLEEAHMRRPLIPENILPEPLGWNRGHERYRRAVDETQSGLGNHALDVFE